MKILKKIKPLSIILALMVVLNLGMGVWAFDLLIPAASVEEVNDDCCAGEIEELEPEIAKSSPYLPCPPCTSKTNYFPCGSCPKGVTWTPGCSTHKSTDYNTTCNH